MLNISNTKTGMVEVGEIQGYPVLYIQEKDVVFCKNTVCRVSDLKRLIESPYERELLEEKNLSIVKMGSSIDFGCLTTTKENVRAIEREIKKIKSQCKKN